MPLSSLPLLWLTTVAVGLVAIGLSLWASILTFRLVLPFPPWISILNSITPVLELGVLTAVSRNTLKSPEQLLGRLRPVALNLMCLMLFAIFVLSIDTVSTPDVRDCVLEKSWDHFFRSKNEAAIRTVQERLRCCGFNSLQDRAWPFPSRASGVNACQQDLGFLVQCAQPWKEQTVVVAVLNALASILNMILTNLILGITMPAPRREAPPIDDSEDVRRSLLDHEHVFSREVVETMEEEQRRQRQRLQ